VACKHEGGTDPCIRNPTRSCVARQRIFSKGYEVQNIMFGNSPATSGNVGQAAEYLVASDLLNRGLSVTKPLNVNGADDLHVRCTSGWKSVQVKSGRKNRKTGTIKPVHYGDRRGRTTSDILAAAYLPDRQIRYISNTDEPLPKELT
jgi:hypothetical protein